MEIVNYSVNLNERGYVSWGIKYNKVEKWTIRSFCKLYFIEVFWRDLEMEGYKIDYMKDPLCERPSATKTSPKEDPENWMVYE